MRAQGAILVLAVSAEAAASECAGTGRTKVQIENCELRELMDAVPAPPKAAIEYQGRRSSTQSGPTTVTS